MLQKEHGFFDDESNRKTVKERLTAYMANWPIFLVSFLVCLGAAIFYLRYTVPKYMVSTAFLVKELQEGKSNSKDIIEQALNGKTDVNLSNEMMLVGSRNLMERTIAKNGFNTSYFIKGRIHSIEIYKEAPFNLIAKPATDSGEPYVITIKNIDAKGGVFSPGSGSEAKPFPFLWGKPFVLNGESVELQLKHPINAGDAEYVVCWQPVNVAAANLLENLSVRVYDTKTNAILISLTTENVEKGKDVLNALFKEFNLMDIEERNKFSENTVRFIDERLLNISKELKGVEGNLENYQGNNRLVDIRGQSSLSLESSNDASKTIKNLSMQQGVTSMILNYFSNPGNNNKLVPSSLGLNDETLTSLITQYNEVQLKRERETPLVAPNSTVMQDLNAQIGSLKSSILESLNNINKNLRLQENNFRQQNTQYQSFLSSIPHNERVMQEIKRKQSITEGLYLYLLQKREEAAISSTASSVPHYKQIDAATAHGTVEPNKKNILISSSLLGFFLAFGFVYFKSLLNDKVKAREDIFKFTSLPLLGEVAHFPKVKNNSLIKVLDRSIIGEQFRSIRTNLSFILKDKRKKVILITSSVSNEGKSFTSLNLAAVYAIPGKKVALLEFDIRKPGIHSLFNFDNSIGLTSYLTGDITCLSDIYQVHNDIPDLHIYPAGPVPLNPADILSSEKMAYLFECLKDQYDYVIVDSPPALLVSDPFIIGQYCDIVIYVLRAHQTTRKQLAHVDELVSNKSFSNLMLVLNDLRQNGDDKKYNGYYHFNNSKTLEKQGKILV